MIAAENHSDELGVRGPILTACGTVALVLLCLLSSWGQERALVTEGAVWSFRCLHRRGRTVSQAGICPQRRVLSSSSIVPKGSYSELGAEVLFLRSGLSCPVCVFPSCMFLGQSLKPTLRDVLLSLGCPLSSFSCYKTGSPLKAAAPVPLIPVLPVPWLEPARVGARFTVSEGRKEWGAITHPRLLRSAQ